MSEHVIVRQFAETLLAACDALDKADEAEKRAQSAHQIANQAIQRREQTSLEAAKMIRDADAHVASSKAYLERAGAEEKAKLESERRDHEKILATLKRQIDEASETLIAKQKLLGAARTEHDELVANLAKLRADAAGMLGVKL